jgi:hypothetical protein
MQRYPQCLHVRKAVQPFAQHMVGNVGRIVIVVVMLLP